MTRVLQITKNLGLGGRERIVAELAGGLIDEGFASTICCLEKSGEWAGLLPKSIKVLEMNKKPKIDWRTIINIRDYLKKNDIDIVHAHNPGTLFYSALSAKFGAKRVLISTEHGFSDTVTIKSRIKEWLLYRIVDRVCAVSRKLAEDLSKTYRLNQHKIHIVQNGVTSAAISEDKILSKKRLGMRTNEFNIGIVARLVRVKNHQMILRAFSLARKKHCDLKLWIVGNGELRKELEELTKQLNVSEATVFFGTRTDVPSILNALDAFVLCSYSEGLSVTMLEAMSAGLPIIATAVGGNREALIDMDSGILVESDNHQQLADAICAIREDPVFADSLGKNARIEYEMKFSVKRMVSQTAAVYRDALNK